MWSMVVSGAFADCHHCAERYVVPAYQRCSPGAADAASAVKADVGGRVSLAHATLSTAVTASMRATRRAGTDRRTRARGDRERIMGAWVDPVCARAGRARRGQRALNDSPRVSITG